MDKYSMESFIRWCDGITIAEENDGYSIYEEKKTKANILGKPCTLYILRTYESDPIPDKKVLKFINDPKLYDYLYERCEGWIRMHEPNIKCNSGSDLMKIIKENNGKNEYCLSAYKYDDGITVTYFLGEYSVDPEHGFSISFPNGKFVTSGARVTELANADAGL